MSIAFQAKGRKIKSHGLYSLGEEMHMAHFPTKFLPPSPQIETPSKYNKDDPHLPYKKWIVVFIKPGFSIPNLRHVNVV